MSILYQHVYHRGKSELEDSPPPVLTFSGSFEWLCIACITAA